MQKAMIGISAAVVVFAVAAALWLGLREGPEPTSGPMAVNVAGSEIGGPFTLVNSEGETVTSDDIIDGPTLVYFGYTFCPDVCPVDAAEMAEATDMLAEQGIEVTPVFITVDPERDTPEQVGWFADALHPEMIGLTGSPEQVRAAADAYKVYFSRVETPESAAEYLMNHTNFTYFMMPDGIAALMRGDARPADIVTEVERVMAARGLAG